MAGAAPKSFVFGAADFVLGRPGNPVAFFFDDPLNFHVKVTVSEKEQSVAWNGMEHGTERGVLHSETACFESQNKPYCPPKQLVSV